jgi:hypothetical protein
MSTPQEYWDACLIRTWRNFGLMFDAVQMFKSITGKDYYEYDPPLLRVPVIGYPFRTGIRIFIANHLSKISKRLLEQPPEKDVLLLKKLKDSKYDTEKDVINDSEFNAQKNRYYRNRLRVGMDTQLYAKRNRDTDWNVIKGTRRGRAR